MHKIIVDTNILISSIIGKGYSRKIIRELVLLEAVEILLTEEILNEYNTVVRRKKFQKYENFISNAEFIISTIEEFGRIYQPDISLDVIKDENDNKFLELAVFAKADFIITGNTNDFPLGKYNEIEIITPKDYWEKYWQK